MTWKSIRYKQKVKETIYIALIIAALIIGIACELLVFNGITLIVVEDLSTVSLTILQIQATIVTIALAVIALISGQSDKQYMGVSYNSYCLEIKPCIFKQNIVIIGLIILVPIGIAFHVIRLYNIVAAIMTISIILLLLSISYIYKIFLGTKVIDNEIKIYIESKFRENNYSVKDIRNNNKYLIELVNDWKEKIDIFSLSDFEDAGELLRKCGIILINNGNNETLSSFENQSEIIIKAYLNSDSKKDKGIILLQDIYSCIWGNIFNHKDKLSNLTTPFKLYYNVSMELSQAINALPIKNVEACLGLDDLTDSILRVDCYIGNDKEQFERDTASLNALVKFLGCYAAKNSNDINSDFWSGYLKNSYISSANIPDGLESKFKLSHVLLYFNYSVGFIDGGRGDIVKTGLYYDSYSSLYHYSNDELSLLPLLVHNYLYYLAEWESESCISPELKESSKKFLSDKSVIAAYNYVMRVVISNKITVNTNLFKVMYSYMRSLEAFPKHSNSKMLIMENAVREFVYFTMLYYGSKYYNQSLIEELPLISDSIYGISFIEDERKRGLKRLKAFIRYSEEKDFSSKEEYNDLIDKQANELFNILENSFSKAIKKEAFDKAKYAQDEFEKVGIEHYQETFSKQFANMINSEFKTLFSETSDNAREKYCHVYSIALETQLVREDMIKDFTSYLKGAFISSLGYMLYKFNMLVSKEKSKLSDDEFIEYLRNSDITHLLGGRHIFRPNDYTKNIALYNEYEKKLNTDYLENGEVLIALNYSRLKVNVIGFDVNIRDKTPDDVDSIKNDETNMLECSVINDYRVGFSKTELSEYIKNRGKVVTFNIKFSIDATDTPIGFIFTY